MRDPHVERLFYRLRTVETVTYEDPPPVTYETITFKGVLDRDRLTVEMKEHHPSERSARARVEEWLRAWEIATCLTCGLDYIGFEFERSEVIDRDPPGPGEDQTVHVTALDSVGVIAFATVHVTRRDYPPPPTVFKASADVETMWLRYQRYKQGKEPRSARIGRRPAQSGATGLDLLHLGS